MDRSTGLPALLFHRRLTKVAISLALVLGVLVTWSPSALAQERSQLAPSCSSVADAVAGTSTSNQLITVVAPTLRSQTATLEFFVRQSGCFRLADGPYPANVGRNGLSTHHREGDETTPMGLFGFQSTMYGVLPNPGVTYQYRRLVCGDWWDEQPSSALYNHFIHVPCGTAPNFGGDSEALWETVPAYDYFAVLDYNRHPIIPGRGSAIFLHVSIGRPTTGCVSIPVNDLLRILRALRSNLHPLIDIATRSALAP